MGSLIIKRDFVGKLAQLVGQIEDLDAFLRSLTEMLTEVWAVSWVSLALRDERYAQFILQAAFQRKELAGAGEEFTHRDTQDPWLSKRQEILSRRLLDEFDRQLGPGLKYELGQPNTVVSLPLFVGQRLIGVLNLGAKADNANFSREDVETFSELSEFIAGLVNQALCYHRLAEQKLHQQNILDNLVSAIVAIDNEGKITVFNRAAGRILGLNPEQALGREARILQEDLAGLLLDTLRQGRSFRRKEITILPENTLVGVSTCQFYAARGQLLGACMVFSRLNEIKRNQRLSREQDLDRYWSNLANSVAHEVKNSILATKVITELFPQKYEDREFSRNLYATLKRDMQKLDNFSDQVLNFAQTKELLVQPCPIDELVDAAMQAATEDRPLGEIVVEKRYNVNLPPISGDYQQLKQAFAQILNNALEAMGEAGKLTIEINREQGPEMLTYNLPEAIKELPPEEIIVVKITDTGSGILSEALSYLFDPFFTTKQGRSGLGLAFARRVVQRHKGLIKAESRPGEGAAFWVCLPLSAEVMEEKNA